MLAAFHPSIDHIGPLLHHVASLQFVPRLVVDAAGRPAVLVCKTFLDPFTVEAEFVEKGQTRPAKIVDSERL